MIESSSSQGSGSNSSSSSTLNDTRGNNTFKINLLFRLTETQYQENLINIEKFINLAEALQNDLDKQTQKKVVIALYDTLMLIPYKYGRQNIDKFDQKMSEGEAWTDSKYLISLGLPNLVEDLQNSSDENLHRILTENLVNEIFKQFVIIGQNLRYYQLQENIVAENGSYQKGIQIREEVLNDLIMKLAYAFDLNKEEIQKNFNEVQDNIKQKVKELKRVLYFQKIVRGALDIEACLTNLSLFNTPVEISEENVEINQYRTIFRTLYDNYDVKLFDIFGHNTLEREKTFNQIIQYISSTKPDLMHELLNCTKNKQNPYSIINKVCLNAQLCDKLLAETNTQSLQKNLVLLSNKIASNNIKQELKGILSEIKGQKGKIEEEKIEKYIHRTQEILFEQKQLYSFLFDVAGFYEYVINTELINLENDAINNKTISLIRELDELQRVYDQVLLQKRLTKGKVNIQEKEQQYHEITKDLEDLKNNLSNYITEYEEWNAKLSSLGLEGLREVLIQLEEIKHNKTQYTRDMGRNQQDQDEIISLIIKLEETRVNIEKLFINESLPEAELVIGQELKEKLANGLRQIPNLNRAFKKIADKYDNEKVKRSNLLYQSINKRFKEKNFGYRELEFINKKIVEMVELYHSIKNDLKFNQQILSQKIQEIEEANSKCQQEKDKLTGNDQEKLDRFKFYNERVDSFKERISLLKHSIDKREKYELEIHNSLHQAYILETNSIKLLEEEFNGNHEEAFSSLSKSFLEYLEHSTPQGMHRIKLIELKRYQEEYDIRTIEDKLRFYKELLGLADSNITTIAAIVEFVNWQKECCGQEIGKRLMNTWQILNNRGEVEVSYLKDLREFRHRAVHCLDDIKKAQDATSFSNKANIEEVSKFLQAMITHLLDHNLEYLKKGDTSKQSVPRHIIRAAINNNIHKCLPELPDGGQSTILSDEQQVRLFIASIENGQKLIKLIKDEIEHDKVNYPLDIIINVSSQKYINLSDEGKRVKLKYSTLLLALGEVLGNLQRHELLTRIAELDIKPSQEMHNISQMIPDVREYRNTLTHHGYHNQRLFDRLLDLIDKESQTLWEETEHLYEKVKNGFKDLKILKEYNFDVIRKESKPLEKKERDRQCITQ